jgi:chromate reductase, NAD(P)H dehydrogenase (quinone)
LAVSRHSRLFIGFRGGGQQVRGSVDQGFASGGAPRLMKGRPGETGPESQGSAMHKVAVIVGSIRAESINKKLARALAKLADGKLAFDTVEIADLPLFNADHETHPPPEVERIKAQIRSADGVLFVTPEHNRSIPAALKNAIDWASRPRVTSPLRDKAVAVMGASPGHGSTARAQAQLRDAFVFTGACVMPLPELLVGSAGEHFDHDGNLTDPALRGSLVELIDALRTWTLRIDLRREAA